MLSNYTTARPMEFKLKTDSKGVTRARYTPARSMRSFSIALDVVRQMESEGRAVEVPALVSDPNFMAIYAGL